VEGDTKERFMRSLVIGQTSQVAQYFPKEDFDFISSRNIDVNHINSHIWDRIYVCSAEQRTFMSMINFEEYNVLTTINLINQIKDNCNKIVVYSTAELWNGVHGRISLDLKHKFNPTPYILSKKKMTDIILNNPGEYSNVIILYPFNFNSTHRKSGFLFHKIFDSILNKRKIEIGNTYFYRELLHPAYVTKQSILAMKHSIVGSGRVIFVNDFIRHLYECSNMKYEDYVLEKIDNSKKQERDIYFLGSKECLYSYSELLSDTLEDIKSHNKDLSDD